MSAGPVLPRRFGLYLLTESLGQDALGSVFRVLRLSAERGFGRLRVLESPEIDEDALLDAIEGNGEIHSFLKNPAIARGVQMDSVDGVAFIAWNEPSGRTLDSLIETVRQRGQQVPIEHALLIGEKIATALDHAYNTTVDGERTLHGLVWPGFVSVSDDGEIRLAGFGLAAGLAPSLARPRFAREIARYLAPEHVASGRIQKNSDVYSVGAILFELLFGRLPEGNDALADLRTATQQMPHITPELAAVLRQCLSPAGTRYQSSGELRRELGKILFSGPYSPSTFNLAFFLNNLFAAEIEAETRQRAREMALDPGAIPELTQTATHASGPAPASSPEDGPPSRRRRSGAAWGGAALVLAALAATAYLISQRPATREVLRSQPLHATPTHVPNPFPTALPAAVPPVPPAASDGQFKDEVARRVAQEIRRLETEMLRNRPEKPAEGGRDAAVPPTALPSAQPTPASPSPTAAPREPTAAPATESESGNAPAPVPTVPSSLRAERRDRPAGELYQC
jgi:serine/threonine protein kinase